MRGVLLSLVCFVTFAANAQTDFCVSGSQWVYGTEGPWEVIETRYSYVGDTAISGVSNVKILLEERWSTQVELGVPVGSVSYNQRFHHIVQKSDSILHLVDGNWQLAFDYDVEVGDTRVVYTSYGNCVQSDTMRITSVDTVLGFLNNPVREYHFEILFDDNLDSTDGQPILNNQGIYFEKIGFSLDGPFNMKFVCSSSVVELPQLDYRCYTDDEIINSGGEPCELVLSTSQNNQIRAFEVYSTSQQLRVKNAQNSTIQIFDVLGKELYQQQVYSDYESIDISHLPKGVLLVSIGNSANRFTRKIYH